VGRLAPEAGPERMGSAALTILSGGRFDCGHRQDGSTALAILSGVVLGV
jgi:hypothetical protein